MANEAIIHYPLHLSLHANILLLARHRGLLAQLSRRHLKRGIFHSLSTL